MKSPQPEFHSQTGMIVFMDILCEKNNAQHPAAKK